MSRPPQQSGPGRLVLPVVVIILILLSLAKLSWIRWVETFGNLATGVFTPGSALVSGASRLLMPAKKPLGETEAERNYREFGEHWKLLSLQHEQEIEQLRRQITELQKGLELNPNQSSLKQLIVPVVGTSSDLSSGLLRVRADEKRGVTEGTVAVAGGLQIVGRVSSVNGATSLVLPITRKNAGKIAARIMMDESTSESLRCLLEPIGDGRFRGQVESPEGAESVKMPSPGFTVRLEDARWPKNAQMLIIGRVETVEKDAASPLRTVITVVPTMPIERVSEMTLRIVNDGPEAETTGGRR